MSDFCINCKFCEISYKDSGLLRCSRVSDKVTGRSELCTVVRFHDCKGVWFEKREELEKREEAEENKFRKYHKLLKKFLSTIDISK